MENNFVITSDSQGNVQEITAAVDLSFYNSGWNGERREEGGEGSGQACFRLPKNLLADTVPSTCPEIVATLVLLQGGTTARPLPCLVKHLQDRKGCPSCAGRVHIPDPQPGGTIAQPLPGL